MRNKSGGIMASAVRASHSTNPRSRILPAARAAITTGSAHPRAPAAMRPYTAAPRPRVTRRLPGTSRRRADGSRLSGTRHAVTAMQTMANGTTTKNTARQDTASTSHPPIAGPTAVVSAENPAHVPIAVPRSCSGKEALMSARLPGTRRAPPTPCTARRPTSHSTDGAHPHAADAVANTAVPTMNTRRRPNRSPAAPPTRISAPRKSR